MWENLSEHESLCGYYPPRCSRAPWVPSELHNKKKAQSHAGAWELSWNDKANFLTQPNPIHYNSSRTWSGEQPCHSAGWLPTCLQVQRDPRLVDVRRVTLGADPPDRSAVYLLLRGRRHVRPAGQRPLASGGTARDSAPQQPLVHPPWQTV